ncbi:uncharacterized protein LOC109524399 isoform X2 [Hippocampus comes]|uniref:uncharacterized protein LOC109524399 isoform X2 n=1 Tax=Hippocampus comes TaxID=109280 RepID=UPI00094E47B6|nr:PREDICTED: uncharacterized protein LOC109524399 isoform X2 [Hippocampus comes]
MSQSSNQPDGQALLQSMLERLKLQPGRERHAHEHADEPLPPVPTCGADGVKEREDVTNGYALGVPAKRFEVSSVDNSFRPKDEERLQPVRGFEKYRGHFFFPPQRDNSPMGVNMVSGNVNSPQISNASTGQHFSAKALPSIGRTDSGVQQDNIFGNKDLDHGFKHNVHDWSWGSTDFTADNQGNKAFQAENGGLGDLSKWKDMQMISRKGSMTKRKQRSIENKGKRWTHKLKERWLERKGKDESKEDERNTSSAQSHLTNTTYQNAEMTVPLLGSSENPTAQSEDDTTDAFIRSSDDFQFSFSSVSLLEEIVSGQEWAKFLNTDLSDSSTNQKTPEKTLSSPDVTPKPSHNGPSNFATRQTEGGNKQWSFKASEPLPVHNDPVNANFPDEPAQNSTAHREADQSEPMEQGQSQSYVQLKQSGLTQPKTSYVERADILDDSPPTSRVNRKRQHHSAVTSQMGWGGEGQQRQGELPNSNKTDGAEQKTTPVFFGPNGSSAPPVPSHFSPRGSVPRSVLRHSASRNSDSLWGSKRRRVEPNRRVHFAETVQVIPPIEVVLDTWDSEEEYGTELGIGSEEEEEEEEEEERMAAGEQKEVPARRHALPAWIRALKRKNTGRKHS